jgi:hypothetical protein
MSLFDKLFGFDTFEIKKLEKHLENNKSEPGYSLLEEMARMGKPPSRKSEFAELYAGGQLPRLSTEIIFNSINCLKRLPEVRLIVEIPNILAQIAFLANQKAESDVKLLSDLLSGVSKELLFGVNIESNPNLSIELQKRIERLKNENKEITEP